MNTKAINDKNVVNQDVPTQSDQPNQDFDYELSWCIQKISQMMQKEKNEKKLRDFDKNLANLKNPNVILIKKRQIMFNLLGDYRSKIKKEQSKPISTSTNKTTIKFIDEKSSKSNSKLIKISTNKATENINLDVNGNDLKTEFKFDFKI